MTLITVQTVCTTFLSHDGMIFGNVGISPMPSSCLTHNNAQRRHTEGHAAGHNETAHNGGPNAGTMRAQ